MNEFNDYIEERQARLKRDQATVKFWVARNKRNLWPLISAGVCLFVAVGIYAFLVHALRAIGNAW